MAGNVYMDVDISDAQKKIAALRAVHTPQEMNKILKRALGRTGRQVKGIVSTEVPKKYNIKKRVVAQDIGYPRTSGQAGADISCCIPITGVRHIIGGKTFPARGGRHGWKGIKAGVRYKITTQIIKGKYSVLPESMDRQGNNPPFRNLGAKRLNNATYTRAAGAGFPPDNKPLGRVTGLAVPQMPMNLAKDEVQDRIRETLQKRLEAEHRYIISKCR